MSREPAFQGVGQKVGIEIWRIQNFQPVLIPKSEHGKFYSGDSYIVLKTTSGKGGSFLYDIHFWIGKDTSQDEAGTAAIKTIELDAVLGGRAVQHRELQGHESDKFLSCFKPCIIPLEGGVASGFKKPEEEEFETRLYVCKGKRVVRMKQVPFARSSLNHDDIFILDTQNKIYQFNGVSSNIQERAKALEVVQFLKENYHKGKCDIGIVEDGKLDTESDSGEFWFLFGGFAPIGKKVPTEDNTVPERTAAELYGISGGEVTPIIGGLSKSMLETKKCYLLDCGVEVFVWFGKVTIIEERKAAIRAAEDFVMSQNRPKSTRITAVMQGNETHSFKSNFESWPSGSATPRAEEGKGRVAAFLKQRGLNTKGAKSPSVVEEVPPLLEGGGKIEVWRIDGRAKTPLPMEDTGKFYSGDCYVVFYTYHSVDRKEDYFLCHWIGKDSLEEDHKMAAQLADTISDSLKGRPVQGRIFQGKEPPQFIALFQPLVIMKGGLSSSYKKLIEAKGLPDETYTAESIALFEISGTSIHNSKAVQVKAVATSLNSTECFVLQSGCAIFTWNGNRTTHEQQRLATTVAEFLKPGTALKHAKEGTETSAFWQPIGGKKVYTSKNVTQEIVRDPRLFSFSYNKGKFEVDEVYNFDQDDMWTEDILILDTRAEVFVWVGQCVDPKEKQNALEIGQKYIEMASSLGELSPNVPLYKVIEGNEPCFFTTFFSWDHTKAMVQGNSFQKKVALLLGTNHDMEDKSSENQGGPRQRAEALAALSAAFSSSAEKSADLSQEKPNGSNEGTPRQRAEALAALTSAMNSSPKSKPTLKNSVSGKGSQRAAAVAALSARLTAEKGNQSPEASPTMARGSPGRSPLSESKDNLFTSVIESSQEVPAPFEAEEVATISEGNKGDSEKEAGQEEPFIKVGETTFSYEQLKAHSQNPVKGIDFKRREAYLSDDEFNSIFEMTKEVFYNLPKWKQNAQRKKFDLF